MRAVAHVVAVIGVIVLVGFWLCDHLGVPLPRPLQRLADRGVLGTLAVAAIVIVIMMLAMIAIDVGTIPERR
jgi:hypothetical protein